MHVLKPHAVHCGLPYILLFSLSLSVVDDNVKLNNQAGMHV